MPKSTPQRQPVSELGKYLRTAIFSAIVFGAAYSYTSWLKIPGVLNKSAADTAIILMGFSMLLSSICYFWNFLDHLIVYRKHLGLVGFAYAITHILLSWSAFLALFNTETWQKGMMWPAFTGLIATIIFTIMALISNHYAASILGGKIWRYILRTGYIAVIFVAAHVVLLKSGRWITWWNAGPTTLPSLSLIVTIFMAAVVVMRIILWIAISRQKKQTLSL